MKYNILNAYREYLTETLQPTTAKTYYNRLDVLFEGQSLTNTVEKLDIQKVLYNLSDIKYKSYFSQSKNAFLYFCGFQNIILSDEQIEQIEILEKNTRRKYRKLQTVDFKEIDKKIKYLKNPKLKLSYQTLLETGLRVSELAQITPTGCTVSDNEIHLFFIGKGGNKEEVTFFREDNLKLYEDLKKRIEKTDQSKKVFYSAIYLQTKAKELGFKCHDLRRVCAKLEYKKTKSKEKVMEKLRHTSIKTTNIYLKSKIKI